MSRRIRPRTSPKRPKIVIAGNDKGGIGKTTGVVATIDLFDLHGQPTIVVQLDAQNRLRKTIGRDVITLDAQTLRASRVDPAAGLKVFRPLSEAIERITRTDEILVLDVGASLLSHFLAFASLSDLDEDLRQFGLTGVVLVPTVAEPESLQQAAIALNGLKRILPSVETVLIENQRDGALGDLIAGSEAEIIFRTQLLPLLRTVPRVVMPAVAGRSWALFERHYCRPLQVVGMELEEVMALSQLPRSEAKIARGDVAAWVAEIEQEFGPILGLGGPK